MTNKIQNNLQGTRTAGVEKGRCAQTPEFLNTWRPLLLDPKPRAEESLGHRGRGEDTIPGTAQSLGVQHSLLQPLSEGRLPPGNGPQAHFPLLSVSCRENGPQPPGRAPTPTPLPRAPPRTGGRVDKHQLQPRFPRRARQHLRGLRVRPADLSRLEARAPRSPEPRGEAGELGKQP